MRAARPARPVSTKRQQRVASHFRQLQEPPGPDFDELARRWLPRALALLIVCVVGLSIWLYGSSARKARAEAIPDVTPTPTARPAAQPGDKTTILVLGSDKRPDDTSFRTDVIILLTVDPTQKTVSALSFPRDLIAKIPGYGDERLNLVMQMGGFPLMQDTLEQSYGVRPEYYLMTNFAGVIGLVNSIGGIEVYAAQPLRDSCDLYWSRAGTCEISKGPHLMDGDTTLWYIRSRHSSNDFDRLRRAQEVMLGIFNRFLSMDGLARVPELYAQYNQDVETNMPVTEVLALLPVAAHAAQHPSAIQRYAITEDMTADWFMWNGARVLLPNYEAIKRLVREAGAAE